MQAIADVETGQVEFELFGDRVCRTVHFDLVTHDVQHAAALEAGRIVFIDEVHRHHDGDLGTLAQAQEIDVDDEVANRIELHVARNGAHLGAVNVDVHQRGKEAAGLDLLHQLAVFERNQLGVFLVSVDYSRNAAFATNGPGGPLAGPVARGSGDVDGLRHRLSLLLSSCMCLAQGEKRFSANELPGRDLLQG
jgi:hypothetical protein